MSDVSVVHDDQSHYEISLTAGQAFIAFVLLLLSLAASFAFGLMIGKGQADERLVVRKEPAVINEASALPKKDAGRIVELGVEDNDFQTPATDTVAPAAEDAAAVVPVTETVTPAIVEEAAPADPTPTPAAEPAVTPAPTPTPKPAAAAPVTPKPEVKPVAAPVQSNQPVYAQLLSTGDQKAAESLAARLIDRGFTSAYVVRGANEKGPTFRVRVKFATESEARAAESRLKEFSREVWITR
ncbi:MAG TPA: SPOR domain-containing protein [Thermoanaerobaculia bacterium]